MNILGIYTKQHTPVPRKAGQSVSRTSTILASEVLSLHEVSNGILIVHVDNPVGHFVPYEQITYARYELTPSELKGATGRGKRG